MRAAVLVAPGEIALRDCPTPRPAPGEAEIAVAYVGVCGSDQARFAGRMACRGPVIFGHEFSGRVRSVRTAPQGLAPGQAVAVAPLLNCRTCPVCRAGREHLCASRRLFGTHVDGAMRETVCMPADRVVPLPPHVSLREGALLEPLAVAVHAAELAGPLDGAEVAVLGAGAIGMLIAQVARALGACRVLVIDIKTDRLRLAAHLGFAAANSASADLPAIVLEHTDGRGAGVVFEATGSPAVASHFAGMVTPGGAVVVAGRMHEPARLDLDALLLKEARLLTSRYFTLADFRKALDLLTTGRVATAPLIQAEVPLECLGDNRGGVVMAAAGQVLRLLVAVGGEAPSASGRGEP